MLAEPVFRRLHLTAFVLLVVSACGGRGPVDAVIAEIGGEPVAASEFESYLRAVSEEDIPLVGGELKSALLDQMLEELLLLRAAEEEGVEVSPEEMRAVEAGLSPEIGVRGPEDDDTLPTDAGRNRLDLAARLKVKKLMDTKILKEVSVTSEEVAAEYEQNRVYYKRPAAVDISQILVETEERANQLLAELSSNGSRFEELAQEHSVGPEAPEGGHLGTFHRGELPSAFETEVFELKRGGLSGVVQTDFGFHIFRVNESYPAEELRLEEVADTIRVELLRDKSDEAFAIFLDDLKERYPVWIDTEKLDFPYLNQNGYDVAPRSEASPGSRNAGR